jgi:hypothetical protein
MASQPGNQTQDQLLQVVRILVRLTEDPNAPDAEADRDRPARRRLFRLLYQVEAAVRLESLELRAGLQALADELADDASFLPVRLKLMVTGLRWASPLDDLQRLLPLVAGRPMGAVVLSGMVQDHLEMNTARWEATELSESADVLTAIGDLASGVVAYVLVKAAGSRLGWPAEWRTRLLVLRRHPNAEVRQLAIDWFIVKE